MVSFTHVLRLSIPLIDQIETLVFDYHLTQTPFASACFFISLTVVFPKCNSDATSAASAPGALVPATLPISGEAVLSKTPAI
jgi:hypothetical protein